MDNKETVRTGYNKIAADYLATRNENSDDVQLLQELGSHLTKGARVLDAGCGAGVPVTRLLSESFQVTGVDFSDAQIQLARRLVPRAEFVNEDITQLTFPTESFDAIVSYYAIIHIPRTEHRALLANFYRMLKPSGRMLVCLGANDLDADVEENYFGTHMYWSHYDAETNTRLVEECGFKIIFAKNVTDILNPRAAHLFVLAHKR